MISSSLDWKLPKMHSVFYSSFWILEQLSYLNFVIVLYGYLFECVNLSSIYRLELIYGYFPFVIAYPIYIANIFFVQFFSYYLIILQ